VCLVNDPNYLEFLSNLLTVEENELNQFLQSNRYTASIIKKVCPFIIIKKVCPFIEKNKKGEK